MPDVQDMDLVREFAQSNSEAAFTELVRRHIALVYSVARRYTGNNGDAQDVTQAVFIILARKAAGLRERTLLPGWLYETTRFTAARLLRTNARRQQREQEAYMQSTLNEADDIWERLSPHLEAAMSRLAERDRALLVLRFYQNKSGPEAAALLGIREDAAQKRMTRAIEKLRRFFAQYGVTISSEAIAGTISANSVQAAPAMLAKAVTATAIAKGATASISTLTLIEGALKVMAWTKAKAAIVIVVATLLAVGTATIAVKKIEGHKMNTDGGSGNLDWQVQQITQDRTTLGKMPPLVKILPTKFSDSSGERTGRGGKMTGINQPLSFIIRMAYGYAEPIDKSARLVIEAELPQGNYDFISSMPDPAEALRQELKNQFGLVAKREMQETDVLLLTVKNPNSQGLKLSGKSQNSGGSTHGAKNGRSWTNVSLPELAGFLESYLKTPVVDQTGLTKGYAIDLKWDVSSGLTTPDVLKQAVLDQLGLELVPARKSIEMLVIEKTTN
jgi:uncharacterized protein (TIGR03435 family)